MAYELIYTSVPQGIRTASSGFCTVAYTNGLSAGMVLKLESLSAYKNYYQPNDPQADENPVAFSHYTVSDSGQSVHILSRISYYGLDYTMRSNKLAHHIAALAGECGKCSCGPAALELQEGFFRTEWQEEPQLFHTRKELEPVDENYSKATQWAEYTGDAGWAGVLAQSFLDAPQRPAFIIFDPAKHVNNLALVDEALRLLPPELRWNVNYNTYFTMLPAGMNCHWRFCVPGAEALRVARGTPGTLVIDLTAELPPAGDGTLIRQAREGKKLQMPKSPALPEVVVPPQLSSGTRLNAPPPPPPPPPPPFEQWDSVAESDGANAAKKRRLLVVAAMVLFFVVIGTVFFLLTPQKKKGYSGGDYSSSSDKSSSDEVKDKNNAVTGLVPDGKKTQLSGNVPPETSGAIVASAAGEKDTRDRKKENNIAAKPVAKKDVAKPRSDAGQIDACRRALWKNAGSKGCFEQISLLNEGDKLVAIKMMISNESQEITVAGDKICEKNEIGGKGIETIYDFTVKIDGAKVTIKSNFNRNPNLEKLKIRTADREELWIPLKFDPEYCVFPADGRGEGSLYVQFDDARIHFSYSPKGYESMTIANKKYKISLHIGDKILPLKKEPDGQFTAVMNDDIVRRLRGAREDLKNFNSVFDVLKTVSGKNNQIGPLTLNEVIEKSLKEKKLSVEQAEVLSSIIKQHDGLKDMSVEKTAGVIRKHVEKVEDELKNKKKIFSDTKKSAVFFLLRGDKRLLRRFEKIEYKKH